MKRQRKAGLLDTNVLVRFLLDDDPVQSAYARELMTRLDTGSETAILEDVVVAETVWVLEKGYGVPRAEITRLLSKIVEISAVRCRSRRVVLEALGRLSTTPCDIVDCLLAARGRSQGLKVYSFDRDFRRLGCDWEPGITPT